MAFVFLLFSVPFLCACSNKKFISECASAVISENKESIISTNTIVREGKELSDYIDGQLHSYALRWEPHPNIVKIDESELGDLQYTVTLYRNQEVTNKSLPDVDTVRIYIYDNAIYVNERRYDASNKLSEATNLLIQQAVKLNPLSP